MASLSKTETALEPSVETESTTEHTAKEQSSTIQASLTRGIDPELIAAVERISPERRVEIEKRLKRKIDCFLFPLLLIFYILNYIVSPSLISVN